jgi:hypothetical protein
MKRCDRLWALRHRLTVGLAILMPNAMERLVFWAKRGRKIVDFCWEHARIQRV